MEISDLAIRIILLFLPGMLCAYIFEIFTVHPKTTPFIFVLNSLILGFFSYVFYWAFLKVFYFFNSLCLPHPIQEPNVIFLKALIDKDISISFPEIFFVSLVSLILGVLLTINSTYKILLGLPSFLWVKNSVYPTLTVL